MLATRRAGVRRQCATGFSDTFTRTSTSTLANADTGQTWTALSGVWGTDGSSAYLVTPSADQHSFAVINTGHPDGTLSMVMSQNGSNNGGGIGFAFRATDSNNLWVCDFGREASWGTPPTFYKRIAGTWNGPYGSGSLSADWLTTDVASLVLSGSSMTLKRNGTTIASYSDSTYSTVTKHGMRVSVGAGGDSSRNIHLDNWSFV